MVGVVVVLVVLVVWGGAFGVGVESNYIKIKSFIAWLVKVYSFQLRLKRGDRKVIFWMFCNRKKHKKRIEHKDNPARRCCSAGVHVDSVKAHLQFLLSCLFLLGRASGISPLVVIEKQKVKRHSFLFPTTGKKGCFRKYIILSGLHAAASCGVHVVWNYLKQIVLASFSWSRWVCGFNSHQEHRHRLKATHSLFKLETTPAVFLIFKRETWWKSVMDGASNFWLSWNWTELSSAALLGMIDRQSQLLSTTASSAHENRSDFCLPWSDVKATLTTC